MDSVAVERATISIYLAGLFSQNPISATEGLTPLTPSSWRVFHFVGHLAQIQPNTLDAFPLLLFRSVQINSLDLTDQTAEAVRPLERVGRHVHNLLDSILLEDNPLGLFNTNVGSRTHTFTSRLWKGVQSIGVVWGMPLTRLQLSGVWMVSDN